RRVSGPPRARPAQRAVAGGGLVLQLVSLLERLSSHRLFERLIRGRLWIGIVAFALIGIVTLQLALLKLNGGVGRALEHEALLQRANAALASESNSSAEGSEAAAPASTSSGSGEATSAGGSEAGTGE